MSRAGSLSKVSNSPSVKKFRTTLVNNNLAPVQKIMPSFQAYLKEYPLDISEDVMEIVKMIEPLQNDFSQNLKSLKLYKQQLGSIFEDNWCDFLSYLKTIIVKMHKRTQKFLSEKESKIAQLLQAMKNIELDKIELQQKISKLQNIRQLQNAQLIMANNELDIVNRQMRNIYKILQSDMSQVMLYLTTLQERKQKMDEDISNEMNASIKGLSTLLDNVEREQMQTGSNLNTMKEMIKAMTKSVKVNTGTQVDESELATNVGSIFARGQANIPLDVADGISVNVASVNEISSTLQKMKQRQKQIPHEQYIPKKSIDKPWALTPTLLVFLENMSKQNEVGRVLPWQYVKQVITEIYEERIKYESEISTSIVGNSMSFDEFVVFFFIMKFKMRRLAEVKLLELIISLKYYTKFWVKAEIFCCLMDVMKFQPYSDPSETAIYKFDHYAQTYFFSIYKYVKKFKLLNDQDGTVYAELSDVRSLIKIALFFTDDLSKSRITSKAEKILRVFDKTEFCELDLILQLILDEYFAIKKKNNATISKAFSKAYDKNKGFFSISELSDVFDSLNSMYKKWDDSVQKYPAQSELYLGKLYLYSITSGRNNNEITLNNFLASTQKYGFECPYPFIRTVFRKKSAKEQSEELMKPSESQMKPEPKQAVSIKVIEPQVVKQVEKEQGEAKSAKSLNMIRVETGSKLFSQHFTILKELNDYVTVFGQTLKLEQNPQVLWKSFNQIKTILERGCQFLKYPLVKQKIN